jgi:GT2 family glycosyltransferase
MNQPKQLTVITPVIRPDLIERMLQTLYEYTEPMFYVYLIDQTVKGLDATKLRNTYKNLMVIRTPKSDVHYTGNLGFAQATNLGITLVQTPYFMMCNDDIEFIHPKWWQGVLDTFAKVEEASPERPAVIVNPSSFKLPDWSIGKAKGEDHYIIPYKEQYNDDDWNFLINESHYVNEHLTIEPGTVIDGVTMYASVCHTQRFLNIGLLDEKYFPGSGEDYDFSCRAAMVGYRCVGTTMSYVFHHWSASFKAIGEEEDAQSLQMPELSWNGTSEKWGQGFDIWGVKCPQCGQNMRCLAENKEIAICSKHPDEIYNMPENTIAPL